MNSELAVVKKVNSLLINKISTLERNQLNSSQYNRRQMIEINPISPSISDANLEQSVCDALSLIGSKISPENLQSCHRMKKADTVIVLFKDRKLRNKVYFNRNNLKGKEARLKELGFSGKLYVNDSLCVEFQSLYYKCRQLKKSKKIFDTWFYNNKINVKINQDSNIINIFHEKDLEKELKIDNLDEFLMFM